MGCNLELTNLNVMVGANASGKSSLLQTLLLLRQSANNDSYVNKLALSGSLYEAGTANDVIHPRANHRIIFTIGRGEGRKIKYDFKLNRDDGASQNQRSIAGSKRKLIAELSQKANSFSYLNAERVGPRVNYDMAPEEKGLAGPIGKHGEYAVSLLAGAQLKETVLDGWSDQTREAFSNSILNIDGIYRSDEISNSSGRIDLLANLFMNWIIPGSEFECSEVIPQDLSTLGFKIGNFRTVRPTHIGFGLTYTLPVIAAALVINVDGLLIVENPEAHLHPFSQSRMGAFLAIIAATGRQIFIETHSDHVINGIRLAVKYGGISENNVKINNFRYDRQNAMTSVAQISVDKFGRLSKWPSGFFDQIETDLAKL